MDRVGYGQTARSRNVHRVRVFEGNRAIFTVNRLLGRVVMALVTVLDPRDRVPDDTDVPGCRGQRAGQQRKRIRRGRIRFGGEQTAPAVERRVRRPHEVSKKKRV